MDRVGVGVDINPVAACLNVAKLTSPKIESVRRRLTELQHSYTEDDWRGAASELPEFFHQAYHRDVLPILLYLRYTTDWRARRVDAFLSELVMGALHGPASSKRYLSNQMPRTISTKPEYSLRFWRERELEAPRRDVFGVLEEAFDYRFASPPPSRRGRALFMDMRNLPIRWREPAVDAIITSPPYAAVASYEEDQWLRLWFLGGPERPGKGRITRDDRLYRAADYWNFVGDFWRVCSAVLKPNGHIVVRIGAVGTDPTRLGEQLVASLTPVPSSY